MSISRILVVEDFVPSRRLICTMLAGLGNCQVVGEASDGSEALRKAVELKPDLILLDIGLPILNGMEVARQLRELVPESRIIFVTQESSSDVVEEALRTGARGFVTKVKVGNDLPAALSAVISGQQFVANGQPS
jgi:DNA-binding NarL/FixJ family response regulator